MAVIKAPQPVKLFIGALASSPESLTEVLEELLKRHGHRDHESGIIPFDFTDYYAEEMGKPLVRKFWSFERLVMPDSISAIKIETNKIEAAFAEKGGVPRPVNIDPGYITRSKVVLATAKDSPRRIYLGGGIYAEVTLTYESGEWRPHRWTYADYRQDSYHQFFSTIRKAYLEQIKK